MYDEMFFKNFFSKHGVPIILAYIGAFALLISISRSTGISGRIPGDVLIKNNETDKVLFFLPFASSAILGTVAYITYRVFVFFKNV